VLLAQGLMACLDINLGASRLAVIKDDRRIDCPFAPISVSEQSLCGSSPEHLTLATWGADPQGWRHWSGVDAQ